MSTQVETALIHHLTAFGNNQLDEILKDYTEQSQIFTPTGTVKGLTAIKKFFEDFFAVIPTGSVFEMKQKVVSGNLAYIAWASESEDLCIPMGTDTFIFEDGKILLHTVADYRISK